MTEYQRLEKVALTYYRSLNELAEKIGISRQAFNDYKKKDKSFSRNILLKLEKQGINPKYIQYGEEPMLLLNGLLKEKTREDQAQDEFEVLDKPKMISVRNLESMNIDEMREYRKKIIEEKEKIDKILEIIDGN